MYVIQCKEAVVDLEYLDSRASVVLDEYDPANKVSSLYRPLIFGARRPDDEDQIFLTA